MRIWATRDKENSVAIDFWSKKPTANHFGDYPLTLETTSYFLACECLVKLKKATGFVEVEICIKEVPQRA